MDRRKRWPFVTALWFIFIVTVAVVAYLSFQSGEDAKALGSGVIEAIAGAQHPGVSVTEGELDKMAYVIRQSGRILAFAVIGIVGTITIHATCKKRGWIFKTMVTAAVLLTIAYLTEKLKVYIPSRHYSYEEMIISITAVSGGFLFVSVITLFIKVIKGVASLRATATHI